MLTAIGLPKGQPARKKLTRCGKLYLAHPWNVRKTKDVSVNVYLSKFSM